MTKREHALTWRLDAATLVRPLVPGDAPAVWELISANRAHLDRWLRWSSGIRSIEDTAAFIDRFVELRRQGNGFHSGIWSDGVLAGGLVTWYIHREHRNAEVGYWLAGAATGRGLATRAARAVIGHLFAHENVHRVEMQCGVDNHRSRAVAERLGFTLEGVRRESHWITDRFVDHAIYGMLARDWRDTPPELG